MLEGDDDAVSLLQEKEIDNLAGKTHTHVRTRIHTCTDSAENKTSLTLVFSAIPSKTFYLQRQVWHLWGSFADALTKSDSRSTKICG